MCIHFPNAVKNEADKVAFLYRNLELLRLRYNSGWPISEWEPRMKAVYAALDPLINQQVDPSNEEATVASSAIKMTGLNDSSWDGWIDVEKINKVGGIEQYVDPLQDYTTFTEVDPNGHFTVDSANQITFTGLLRQEAAYLYKDFGVDRFCANFRHLVATKCTAQEYQSVCVFWALANGVGSYIQVQNTGATELLAFWYEASDYSCRLYLQETVAENSYSDHFTVNLDTQYYLTMYRDESYGTYGRLYCYIYDDSGRTSLVGTNAINLHEKADLRYLYGLQTSGPSPSVACSGTINNLDIQAVPYSQPVQIF